MHELDARNLLCPLPVIRTQDRMGDLGAGERLRVRCTDPGALQDIPTWCRLFGHRVLHCAEDAGEYVIEIEAGMGQNDAP